MMFCALYKAGSLVTECASLALMADDSVYIYLTYASQVCYMCCLSCSSWSVRMMTCAEIMMGMLMEIMMMTMMLVGMVVVMMAVTVI